MLAKILISFIFLTSLASAKEVIEAYCETGDPSGGGPQLIFTLTENDSGNYKIDLKLSINTFDPELGTPNIDIRRMYFDRDAYMHDGYKFFNLVPISPKYGVQIFARGEESYAKVISANNSFDTMYLVCETFGLNTDD